MTFRQLDIYGMMSRSLAVDKSLKLRDRTRRSQSRLLDPINQYHHLVTLLERLAGSQAGPRIPMPSFPGLNFPKERNPSHQSDEMPLLVSR